MMEILDSIQSELINMVIVIITTCISLVATYITKFLKEKGIVAKLEKNEKTVKIVVNAVEQLYHEHKGQEKFELAKKELVELLNSKKIKITEQEIKLLIESAVREANASIKKELDKSIEE